MGQFLYYAIVGGFVMSALYITYKWCMASERLYSFNRITLLAIYAVSFGLFPVLDRLAAAKAGDAVKVVHVIGISAGFSWQDAVQWIYVAGVAVMSVASVVSYVRIASIIRRGETKDYGKYKVVLTGSAGVAPFSWLRYIVLSRRDYNDAGDMIVCHEKRHLDCLHWVDLIVAQLVIIFNWFNPVVWLMRRELRTVHEYQADMAVLQSGANARDYQLLLIRKAVGKKIPAFVNSLNHSMLKKRIEMMLSDRKGGRFCRLRAAIFVPAIFVAVAVLNIPAIGSPIKSLRAGELYSTRYRGLEEGVKTVKSSPEIYLDGVLIDDADMNDISPSEIKSITVDKSSDSPNGRIRINTK